MFFYRNPLKWVQKQKLFVEEQLETTSDTLFARYYAITEDQNKIFINETWGDGPSGEFRGGAVYVFENINGEFVRTRKISPPTNIGDLERFSFGRLIEINNDGTKIIQTAPYAPSPSPYEGNSFLVFEEINGSYELTQAIPKTNPLSETPTYFKLSSDEKKIVAAYAYDSTYGDQAGSVEIYESSSIGYQQVQYITASYNTDGSPKGATAGDFFGLSTYVTADMQKLFISSVGDDEAASGAGAVYIFQSSSVGYQQVQKLTASFDFDGNPETARAGDGFGRRMTATPDGNTLAIGAFADDENGVDSGAVYIFQTSSVGYQQVQKFSASFNTDGTPETSPENDQFGDFLSFSDDGNILSIYSRGDEEDGGGGGLFDGSGAVYIYVSSNAGYVQQDKLISLYNTDGTLETPTTSQVFGFNHKLLSDGKTLLSYGRNNEFGYNSRFLYVFRYTRDY